MNTEYSSYIQENSLYTPDKKDDFLKDEKAIMDAFLYNFIGTVAFYEAAIKKEKVLRYIKSDLRLRVDNITDDNNDMSLIIKIMNDKGYFRTDQTVTQITKFMAKLKTGSIDNIDVEIVKEWINAVKPDVMKSASMPLRRLKDDLLDNGDLVFYATHMRYKMKKFDVTGEFQEFTRGVTLKKSVRQKMSDPIPGKVTPAQTSTDGVQSTVPDPINTDTDTGVEDPTDDSDDVSVDTDIVTPPKKRGAKEAITNPVALAQDISKGNISVEDIKSGYKVTPDDKRLIAYNLRFFSNMFDPVENIIKDMSNNVMFAEEFLTKPQKANLADNYGQILWRAAGRTKDHVEILKSIVELGKNEQIINFIGEYSKNYDNTYGISLSKNVYGNFSIAFRNSDREGNTVPVLLPYVNEIKALDSSNPFSFDSYIDINNRRGVNRDMVSEITYAVALFIENGTEAFRILNTLLPTAYIDKGGRAVYNKKDGSWDPWSYDYGIKLMEFLGVQKTSMADEVYVAFTEYFSSKYDTIEDLYSKDREEFIKGVKDVLEDNPTELIKTIFNTPNTIYSFINDSDVINLAIDALDRTTDAEIKALALDIGLTILHAGSGSGYGNRFTVGRARQANLSIFESKPLEPLVNKIVNDAIDFIENNFQQFAENVLNANFYTAEALYSENQRNIKEISSRLGRSDFPSFYAKNWYNLVVQSLESGEASLRYGTDFMYAYGLRLSLIDDPGEIIGLLSRKELDHLRILMLPLFFQNVYSKRYIGRLVSGNGKVKYSELSTDLRLAFDEILNSVNGDAVILQPGVLFDDEFYEKHLKERLSTTTSSEIFDIVKNTSDEKLKKKLVNEFFKENPAQFNLVSDPTTRSSGAYTASIEQLLVFAEYSDELLAQMPTAIEKYCESRKGDSWWLGHMLRSINDDNSSEKFKVLTKEHRAISLKNAIKYLDDKSLFSKNSIDYKDRLPDIKVALFNILDEDRNAAQEIYGSMSLSMRRQMAADYIQRQGFVLDAETALHQQSEKNPIISYQKLTKARIKEILKYNNVINEETKLSAEIIKTFDSMDEYISNENSVPFEDLKVELIETTEEERMIKSAELHLTKRSNKHGSEGLKILRSFNVAIPLQQEEQAKFLAEHPDTEILNPMYHGTGSIAAAMILRYGFKVISSGDKSVVGRMLGDGIYAAVNIDKAQQYVGDDGYSRHIGTKGYIFEINGALGERNVNYRVAGLGNDRIRSPEWCVFDGNAQYKIFKAHEVEIISSYEAKQITRQYGNRINESSNVFKKGKQKFSRFLQEEEQVDKNYCTYTFITGVIPTGDRTYVDFEDYEPQRSNVSIEPSAYGPSVVVQDTEESGNYMFTSIADMAVNHPEIYKQFLEQTMPI
jgi:hypothetical protein